MQFDTTDIGASDHFLYGLSWARLQRVAYWTIRRMHLD